MNRQIERPALRRIAKAAACFCGAGLILALGTAARADAPQTVVTAQMELEFRDGWLTRWKNKLTDEEVRFGAGAAIPEAQGSKLLKADEATAALTQAEPAVWAVRAPAAALTPRHADAGPLRQRYLLLQARSGGLLLLLDDPALERNATLARDDGRSAITLTLRSPGRGPARWLIRQYLGGANWGAQHWQDYLARTHSIPPRDQRPTAWAQNVAFTVFDPPWCAPVPGAGWEKSQALHHAWLDNLQRVVDADKVLFVAGNGPAAGAAHPYAALMAGPVRRMGYHVMLQPPPAQPHWDDEAWRQQRVGELLAAVRAMDADAVGLADPPADTPASERVFFKLLRATLDQNGLAAVAIGVVGEASEAALPFVDFGGPGMRGLPAQPIAPAEALRAQAPGGARLTLDALLTDEERQAFGLPPRTAARACTALEFGAFALARFWGENQPQPQEPKFLEAGELARYRLADGRGLRLSASAAALRLVFDSGETLAELTTAGWTNSAALLDKYGPAFLRDQTAP